MLLNDYINQPVMFKLRLRWKKYCTALFFISIFFFGSCKEEKKEDVKPLFDFNNPQVVTAKVKEMLGDDIKFAYKGFFDKDSTIEIAAGKEITTGDKWGIKFFFLKLDDDELKNIFETEVLEGSFNESLVKKIKFPSLDHELIYYNSGNYFLGSGGGEVFTYVIDFNNSEVYYAHLLLGPKKTVSLFLSDNIENPDIKDIFIRSFKKDYPALSIVEKDIELE